MRKRSGRQLAHECGFCALKDRITSALALVAVLSLLSIAGCHFTPTANGVEGLMTEPAGWTKGRPQRPSACGAQHHALVRHHGVAAAPLSGVERTVGRICMRYEKVFDGPARLFGERGRAPDIEPGSKNANSSPP